jgi:hypothetical protein
MSFFELRFLLPLWYFQTFFFNIVDKYIQPKQHRPFMEGEHEFRKGKTWEIEAEFACNVV